MKMLKMKRASAFCMSVLLAAGSLSAMPPMSALAAGQVVVNEICTKNTKLAAPDGEFYDYIELYNTGSSEAAVGGYALSDDASQPKLYVIPEGTVIPANGYLVVYCGVKAGGSVKGAEFGLSKSGETVRILPSSEELPAASAPADAASEPTTSSAEAVFPSSEEE